MTPPVESTTLLVHIGFGVIALLGGAGAILTVKGGRRHRLFGRTYVGSMTVVVATALALYPLNPSRSRLFLGLIAVFSYYFVFSGFRVLGRKRPTASPASPDWVAVGLLGVVSASLVLAGVVLVADGATFGPVLVVFGGIGAVFAGVDVRAYLRPDIVDRHWALSHLTRMGAGYIATVTAVATVNLTFLPTILRWLGPTVVGSIGIVAAVRRYRPRFVPDA